jgi:hypothetical protein
MDAADFLSFLNAERQETIGMLNDENLACDPVPFPAGGDDQHAPRMIARLRKETEYAFSSALFKEEAAHLYVRLTTVNAQIILFLTNPAT